jgi:fatty acid desaturase
MDAVFTRRRLIEPARLRELNQRSDLAGALQLGSHLGAIGLSGWLVAATWGTWWAVPVFFVHGVLINFLYAGQHELSHATVFRTKWPNALFGRLIGFALLYPRDFDKIQHWAHHQFTQNWEKDGELVREPYTLTSYLLWFWGPTYWQSRVRRLFRFARENVTEPYIRPDEHATVIREARLHLAGYAAIAAVSVWAQSWAAVTFWLAPMLLTKFVHQMQNTIEHLGLSHADDILENTRSTRTNALMRWLCWQMPYHTAHHAFPSVPFWKLRALDAEIRGRAPKGVHEMGWIAFQLAVLRAFANGKTEADYPHNEVWIAPRADGRWERLPAA